MPQLTFCLQSPTGNWLAIDSGTGQLSANAKTVDEALRFKLQDKDDQVDQSDTNTDKYVFLCVKPGDNSVDSKYLSENNDYIFASDSLPTFFNSITQASIRVQLFNRTFATTATRQTHGM